MKHCQSLWNDVELLVTDKKPKRPQMLEITLNQAAH